MSPSGPQDQSGSGLAAVAAGRVVVIADEELVDRQCAREGCIEYFDKSPILRSARDVGLIRNDEEQEVECFEPRQCRRRFGDDRQILERARWVWLSVAHDRSIENAVAVEENGAHAISAYLVTDSHFVCARFSAGWLTIKCQTTAWNASACGVTFSALTVGMRTTASATLAV